MGSRFNRRQWQIDKLDYRQPRTYHHSGNDIYQYYDALWRVQYNYTGPMNRSMDASQSGHYMPPIARNDSASIAKTNRSMSEHEMTKVGSLNAVPLATRSPVVALRNAEEYESMNEKELLREHEGLLKILKKYQEIIDDSLLRKQKERDRDSVKKSKNGDKRASKEQVMAGEIANNKKIIENYLREIKELETAQKQRKLHEVLDEKAEILSAINKVKKEIFDIKNQDSMASRDLLTNRDSIERELKDAEKDLKVELTRNTDYKKRIEQLNDQLRKLKQQCSKINITELSQQSQQKDYLMLLAEKRMELEQVQRNHTRIEQSIQQVMINKTKRNKGVAKEIEGMERKITEFNNRIAQYKEKVTRYQKVIEVQSPK